MEKIKFYLKAIESESPIDGRISISGTVMADIDGKGEPVIDFYEHPIEGGYYSNGEAIDDTLYAKLLEPSDVKTGSIFDEMDIFNKIVVNLYLSDSIEIIEDTN